MIQTLTEPFEVLRATAIERRLEMKRHIVDYVARIKQADLCVLCGSGVGHELYRRDGAAYTRRAGVYGGLPCLRRMIGPLAARLFGGAACRDFDGRRSGSGSPLCAPCLDRLHQHPAPVLSGDGGRRREPLPLEVAMRVCGDSRDIRAFAESFGRRVRRGLVREFTAKRLGYRLGVIDEQISMSYARYRSALEAGEVSDAECLRVVHNDLCVMRQQLLDRLGAGK